MHGLSLRIGNWRFAPRLWPTLAMLFFVALTAWLGNWQSGRADTKRTLQARYDAAFLAAPIHVGTPMLDKNSVLYRKLEVTGRFDAAHGILIDNRIRAGVAGYHVLMPLVVEGGRTAILVNRGWVAADPARAHIPDPPVPAGRVALEGIAGDPHSRYVELGDATPRDRVWQNLDFERYARTYPHALQPVLLMQTSATADGLARDWPRPDTGVDMHVGYAFQWYSLATTLVVLWVVLNLRRSGSG